eukprot:TRINITY_DN4919_c2_g1_i1.p1 TRINITY_DN4919_c2_g1~~TRINITY_DN4919_c2_g1_i1.p1  ORF type:complete len:330 (+),score=10.05 TRINITY_DN4919_c2_g1_i1:96-1085(+)
MRIQTRTSSNKETQLLQFQTSDQLTVSRHNSSCTQQDPGKSKPSLSRRNSTIPIFAQKTRKQRKSSVWDKLFQRKNSADEEYDPYANSGRISRAIQEFGKERDWMSALLLQHFLASIIQARWRGVIQRRKFRKQMDNIKKSNQAYFKQMKQTPFLSDKDQHQRTVNEQEFGKPSETASTQKPFNIIRKFRSSTTLISPAEYGGEEDNQSDWSDLDEYELDALKVRPVSAPWIQSNADISAIQSSSNTYFRQGNAKLDQYDKETIVERLNMIRQARQNMQDQKALQINKTENEIEGPSKQSIEEMLIEKFAEKSLRLHNIQKAVNSHNQQ